MLVGMDVQRRDDTDTGDATRRTHLANERTQLAWWRTGLTAVAVGVGLGRIVPALTDGDDHGLYAAIGIGYVVYGVAFVLAGTWRQRQVEVAVMDARFRRQDRVLVLGLTLVGVALALATAVLIAVSA